MQPSTEIMSYQNPPIIKKDGTAVPLGTTITPPTMTTTDQRSKRMIAIAAVGMMLVAGVVLMQDGGSAYNHLSGSIVTENGSILSTAEVLVVYNDCCDCTWSGKGCAGCCNTCDEVKEAYKSHGWDIQETAKVLQCNATQLEAAAKAQQQALPGEVAQEKEEQLLSEDSGV